MNDVTEKEIIEKLGDREWRINHLYYIKDGAGKKVLFKMNPVQKMLYDSLHTRNIIPKARKLGISSFFAIFALDHILFTENRTAGIIAHTQDAMKKLFRNTILFAVENMHPWLKSYIGKPDISTANELKFNNGGQIFVALTTRGDTPNFLHCIHPDQDIVMEDGYVKKIKEIKKGDSVISGRGYATKVINVLKQKTNEEMLSIDVFGNYETLKVTENHLVFCRERKMRGDGKWKMAKDIEPGDYVAFPRRKARERHIDFDFDIGRIAGLYLAEGTLDKKELTFSVHRKEVPEIVSWLQKYEKEYNSLRIYNSKGSLTSMITVNSWSRISWFRELFGEKSDKKISEKVFGYTISFLKGILFGYFYGDGCLLNPREISVCGIRRQILEQIRRLCITTYYGIPTLYFSPAGMKYGRKCKDMWTLKLMGDGNWDFRKEFGLELPKLNTWSQNYRVDRGWLPCGRKFWRRGKNHYFARVKSIETIESPEYVYDISVEDKDHSFLTTSGVVHNCSELGYISLHAPDKAAEIISGGVNSVTVDPKNMVSIESTADSGRMGPFYEICMAAERLRASKQPLTALDFKIHFFPWWLDPQYELPDAEHVILTQDQEEYFKALEKEIGKKLSIEKKRWWVKSKEVNGQNMFVQFPGTLTEAFSVSLEGAYFKHEMDAVFAENRVAFFPIDPMYPVTTSWDLGMSDSTAISFFQSIGPEIRFIDYYESHGVGLEHYVKVLREKGYSYNKHILPHDIEVKDLSTGVSRLNFLWEMGVKDTIVAPKVFISDSIEKVRILFPRFRFDKAKAGRIAESLQIYRKEFDDTHGTWLEKPWHGPESHCVDTIRTLSTVWVEEFGGNGYVDVWGDKVKDGGVKIVSFFD